MPCSWDRSTERYSNCDGHSRCYCPHCKKCGEAVDSQKHLDNNGFCRGCQKHLDNVAKGIKCGYSCYQCDIEAENAYERSIRHYAMEDKKSGLFGVYDSWAKSDDPISIWPTMTIAKENAKEKNK